jgi:exodeoxyribonuclease V alpha subunit
MSSQETVEALANAAVVAATSGQLSEAAAEIAAPEPDERQAEAIALCVDKEKRLTAVTGGAGTGKTTILRTAYFSLVEAGYSVALAAPTGKAAKRITEATGIRAVTFHRLLGYGMPDEVEEVDEHTGAKKIVKVSKGPRFGKSNPLPFDFVIGDEYAMVNHEINRSILDALKPGACLREFGDENQLKPIEENKANEALPSPFLDTLSRFPNVRLEKNWRQLAGSGIAENSLRLLKGLPPKRDFADFTVKFTERPVDALQELVMDSADNGIMFNSPDYQIITPMNKTWVGVHKLNGLIQQAFWNRDEPAMELPRPRWYEGPKVRIQKGDKVVFTANAYELELFNGEVGNVIEIDFEEGSIHVDFGDRVIAIPPLLVVQFSDGSVKEYDPRMHIDLAYALTTHKMQGSEVKGVVYVLNKSTMFNQSRRNFYTAITRAREKCWVITDQGSLQKSVQDKR